MNPPIVRYGDLAGAVDDAALEAAEARAKHNPYNSAHEAYGVLAEEFKEFEEHVFAKQDTRDLAAMRRELIQIAAVALRAAAEVCDEDRGRR